MILSIFVDGSGGSDSGFGFFVKETGESFYKKEANITNNQAEYMAIISVLKKFSITTDEIIIYSDSKNTVSQLNHEYAINNEQLRDLAREAWELVAKFQNLLVAKEAHSLECAGLMRAATSRTMQT